MKKQSPAFQFYPDAWLSSAKIMLMTPDQEGAYIRLLAIAWLSDDCGLPDDDEQLAALSRLNEGWFNGGSDKIRKCFEARNGKLYNARLLLERKKQKEWIKKSSDGGKKSWQVRKDKGKMTKNGYAKGGSPLVSDCFEPKPNSSSLSSSLSINKKDLSISFKKFWEAYPKRQKRPDAENAWQALRPDPALVERIVEDVKTKAASEDWTKDNRKYCPGPGPYLRGKRWEDEEPEPAQPSKRTLPQADDDWSREYRKQHGTQEGEE